MSTRRLLSVAAAALLTVVPAVRAEAQQHQPTALPQRFSVSGDGGPVDTMTAQFDVGGVRVILRRNTANDVVAANLYLLGGTQQVTSATQGIEPLLLAASERGTRRYPGDRAREATARLGTTITIEPSTDWTVFGLRGIRSTFDSSWSIFADRLMDPSLDSAQVELVRGLMLAGLQQRRAEPDEALQWLADSVLFANQPYGLSPEGTPSSLARITLRELRDYQRTQFVTSRMLLVVVGNVSRADVEALVGQTLAKLPRGTYSWRPPAPPVVAAHTPYVRRESLPTNYLLGYWVGPRAGSPDFDALRLAAAVLSGRFFTEIRSRRNLTYAVDAPFVSRAFAVGGVYVTTVKPDSALQIMRAEITELQRDVVDPAGLQRLVQQFITDYYLKNETNGDQANLLAEAALYEGDYRAAGRFVEALRHISPEDIRRAAQQYMRDFQLVYIGDPSKLSPEVARQF